MKRAFSPRSAPAALRQDPPLSLADIMQALCASIPASSEGLEYFLDRIEKQP